MTIVDMFPFPLHFFFVNFNKTCKDCYHLEIVPHFLSGSSEIASISCFIEELWS